jgi:glycosyltransferase involved in cell wall biosynthesis
VTGVSRPDGSYAVKTHTERPVLPELDIAVLIPCHNEESTVGTVIRDFAAALPEAAIYVYDNRSTDHTAAVAQLAGATVRYEPIKGKGNVIRRMFADIDADIYVLVDGDDTYDAASTPRMIERLLDGQNDMVSAVRVPDSATAYRAGHRSGNLILSRIVALIFGDRFSDILSGFRVMSCRFVKSFPALARGFDIETELTIHSLELGIPAVEVATPYRARPSGSVSKLHTFRDGFRILLTVVTMIKEERPLQLFASIFAFLQLTSLIIGWPILLHFIETGLVPRLPTAVLTMGITMLAFLSLACGLILDTVTRGRREFKRLRYLSYSPISGRIPNAPPGAIPPLPTGASVRPDEHRRADSCRTDGKRSCRARG